VPLSRGRYRRAGSALGAGGGEPTRKHSSAAITKFLRRQAEPVLKAYAATTATKCSKPPCTWPAHASFPTARGVDRVAHADQRQAGVRYLYAKVRPPYLGMPGSRRRRLPAPGRAPRNSAGASRRGALRRDSVRHGNLDLDKRYAWEPADYDVSKTMQAYFVNFIKTGKPDGRGFRLGRPTGRRPTTSACGSYVTPQAEPEPTRPVSRAGFGDRTVGASCQRRASAARTLRLRRLCGPSGDCPRRAHGKRQRSGFITRSSGRVQLPYAGDETGPIVDDRCRRAGG